MADDSVAADLLYEGLDDSSPTSLVAAKHSFDISQLQAQLVTAKAETEALRQQLQTSEALSLKYQQQCAVFARNVSVLFDTAVAEVKRKNEEIDRLKEWKEAQERKQRRQQQMTSSAPPFTSPFTTQPPPRHPQPPTPPPSQGARSSPPLPSPSTLTPPPPPLPLRGLPQPPPPPPLRSPHSSSPPEKRKVPDSPAMSTHPLAVEVTKDSTKRPRHFSQQSA